MTSPNSDSDQSYANALKQGDSVSRSSSPTPSKIVTVTKRKRVTSSSSESTVDSSSSSRSSKQPYVSPKQMSDVCDKIMHDAVTSPNGIATQTEEELMINASIVQNQFVKMRDDRRFQLSYDLQVEREKSTLLANAVSKILEFSVSGLAAAQHELVFKDQRHSLAFSGAIDIKPEARVFDEEFWRPMMSVHQKWDKEWESNAVISNKLKLSLGSIVNECRDVSSNLEQRRKPVHPLVIKSKKLCRSLPTNISYLSKSKEARRTQSSRLCNSESPKDKDKVSLTDYSKFQYVQFPKQQYNNSFSTPVKSLAQKLPTSPPFDPHANDSKYLKARKTRFAQNNNDAPTKMFVEQSSSESLIEIKINVKVTVPVDTLAEKVEFNADFPNLQDIVEKRIKEFRSNADNINLENFDISQEEDEYDAAWERYISSKVKKEAVDEE